jgi:hypothetical protein
VILVLGVATINAMGVYARLVAGHVGEQGAIAAANETRDAEAAARIEVAAGKVADLDRRLAQIDDAVAEANRRGRTNTALGAMESQRKARATLAGEREKAAQDLADLKAKRAGMAAQGHQTATEAAPITYVAELFGIHRDPETITRWLIALMVMCCDPLALALTAAVGGRRSRQHGG